MLICGAKHLKVDLPAIDKVVLKFDGVAAKLCKVATDFDEVATKFNEVAAEAL